MEPSFSTGPIGQPAPAPPQAQPGPAQLPRKAKGFWLAALAGYVASFIVITVELTVWTLVDMWIAAVAVTVAALAGSASIVLLILKHGAAVRAGSRQLLKIHPIELLGRLATTSGPLFVVIGILIAANCFMDPSAGPAQRIEVSSMSISRGKSTHYDLHLRSWRPGEDTITVTVDEETYRKIESAPESRRAAMVEVRKGRLGLAWTGSIRPAE